MRGPASYERLLPDEVAAIKAFALQHPRLGYRKLSYMMLHQDIVAASESAVNRVLREAALLSRWKRSSRSPGVYTFRPTAPNQQWHSEVMYVWVGSRHYFLLSFIDAYSRCIVHHRLLPELSGRAIPVELEAALARCGSASRASCTTTVASTATASFAPSSRPTTRSTSARAPATPNPTASSRASTSYQLQFGAWTWSQTRTRRPPVFGSSRIRLSGCCSIAGPPPAYRQPFCRDLSLEWHGNCRECGTGGLHSAMLHQSDEPTAALPAIVYASLHR